MNGTILPGISNLQYSTCSYFFNNATYSGIHVFTTTSKQSIAPIVCTTRVPLADMSPAAIQASKVIAKVNGGFFDFNTSTFYGLFYQGENLPIYVNGVAYQNVNSIPTSSYLFVDRYWSTLCVKNDGSATIRWFSNNADLSEELEDTTYTFSGAQTLVFNRKCVYSENVYDQNGILIYNRNSPGTNDHFNPNYPTVGHYRTLIGHLYTGNYIFVATDCYMPVDVAAYFMQDIGCDYALNMDGSLSSEMRIKDGYGASGRVTGHEGRILNTAVCAYIK